ncbi:MAG: 3-methyl-2-oxobutanoate hydroxymethyltransferase [Candidatus Omnitrophica bacterium]|nr:3-methyl-2-oxobutanoate hydroxymethyltransferase [Candidatus Omnitrophota bacterium]
MAKITIPQLKDKKERKEKIVALTAYDYPIAKIVEKAGIDIIIVGDSLGNVVLGYNSTIPVSIEEMLHHLKAVRRGALNTFVVADMPFMSYQISNEDAVANAGRLIKESEADAVKLEGGKSAAERIQAIINAGIPVMGHLGLTPQTATSLGGLKVQGKDLLSAEKIYRDSITLEKIGCFALILECVPQELAKMISERLSIPTIGIGAGSFCDGQVLVSHDILGLGDRFKPKFVKQYLDLEQKILLAVSEFKNDVLKEIFPQDKHAFKIDGSVIESLKKNSE